MVPFGAAIVGNTRLTRLVDSAVQAATVTVAVCCADD